MGHDTVGLLIDPWRFDVFSGRVGPDEHNRHWWELRSRYQGVAPPIERTGWLAEQNKSARCGW